MNKLYFSILLCILISCKKETSIIKTGSSLIKDPKTITFKKTILSPFESKTLNNIYKSYKYKTIWQSEVNRKTVLKFLTNAGNDGLDPANYNANKLNKYESKFYTLRDSSRVNYDILLTFSFQKYLKQLHNGKLDPQKIYKDWDIKIKAIDVNSYLNEGIENKSFAEIKKKCEPQSIVYKKLIKALNIIDSFPNDNLEIIRTEDKITLNDSNSALIPIKKRLLYWHDLTSKGKLNMLYDQKTFDAIKKFQNRHGLASDGVIGKGTIAALNISKKSRRHQIIANLERWRWFEKDLKDNYVIVNIPNYSLNVVENKDTTLFRRVVVGTFKRQTPILTSTLKTVVFNPTWTVPPTILEEDVVPAMHKNRNYLKNKSITIYDTNNVEVEPLLWDESKPNNYRYVQKSGYYNSLGLVKIDFPNRHSVYMHDTNHRELFVNNRRSLSSGCVRVENPLELAQHILNNKKWPKEKIDAIINNKETIYVKIPQKYAMYLWYWTAWSEKKELVFREDIYELDSDLYTKLRS